MLPIQTGFYATVKQEMVLLWAIVGHYNEGQRDPTHLKQIPKIGFASSDTINDHKSMAKWCIFLGENIEVKICPNQELKIKAKIVLWLGTQLSLFRLKVYERPCESLGHFIGQDGEQVDLDAFLYLFVFNSTILNTCGF